MSHTFVQIRLAISVFVVQTCSELPETLFWIQNKVLAGMLLSFTLANKANLVPVRQLRTVLKAARLSGCVYSSLKSRKCVGIFAISALLWLLKIKMLEQIYWYILNAVIIISCILMPSLLHSWSVWGYSCVNVYCFFFFFWFLFFFFLVEHWRVLMETLMWKINDRVE